MTPIPLANILQHKLRSGLTAIGIAIGVCMLITLSGLARGTLYEIPSRWEKVDADLILTPRGWGGNVSVKEGGILKDGLAADIVTSRPDLVQRVVPVFLWSVPLGGQNQMAVGVAPEDWKVLTGGQDLQEGELFDKDNRFAEWLTAQMTAPTDPELLAIIAEESDAMRRAQRTEAYLLSQLNNPDRNGLELVIDSRLAHAGNYRVGDTVRIADFAWTIVGVVPEGGMARVYMPRRTAQFFGSVGFRSTIMFVKLHEGIQPGVAARAITEMTQADAIALSDYRASLVQQFSLMFIYVDLVNVIAMGIAFLFTMVMLYAMVLERRREIAILRANGASSGFLVRQVIGESLLITVMGIFLGVALSFLSAWAIHTLLPLMTVQITISWVAMSIGLALLGGVVCSLYPAWRATRVDIAEVLSLE
jgi:putative ABC transport system permease protein